MHDIPCTLETRNEENFSNAGSKFCSRFAGVCADRGDFTFNYRQAVGRNDGEPGYAGCDFNVNVQ